MANIGNAEAKPTVPGVNTKGQVPTATSLIEGAKNEAQTRPVLGGRTGENIRQNELNRQLSQAQLTEYRNKFNSGQLTAEQFRELTGQLP